jgi:kynureninase
MTIPSRDECLALDRTDPLRGHRDGFSLPDGVIYLDGNSLGALPKAALGRLEQVAGVEWGRDLITSWNKHGWIDLPSRVGEKIARLIGAEASEVVVSDSTSINLFKTLYAALKLRKERRVIVSEHGNFPTDLYTAEGLIEALGNRHRLRLVKPAELAAAVDSDTAIVMLTHVNYRTGSMHDLKAVTAAAQKAGALMVWDLAHSVGAVPVDLNGANADFAVGCGYKYLNGGPGAPAFLYAASRHHAAFTQPLTGWLGHADPFAFEASYRPAPGIARALCGTPPILSLAALEVGVDGVLAADPQALRAKSMALGDLFIAAIEGQGGQRLGITLASPRDATKRGSQVSFRHAQGYPVMQALIARGVVGDFRAPDILRFGFAALYVRYVDVWDAARTVIDILENQSWDRPEFKRRAAVT